MKEARIIDIESKLAYQEDALNKLNDALYRQQTEIDKLQTAVKILTERLADLSELLRSGADTTDEKPPHY
ncbi:MAG: SlyX family protein [Gammaproteobacteria bacterium]